MKRKILIPVLCLILGGLTIYGACAIKQKHKKCIPFSEWPQIKFKDIRILIATEPKYAHQGFAGAKEADFEKTLIIFPGITGGAVFTNQDQGYGPVIKDIKIVYLDANMNVLKEDILVKERGISVAPEGTCLAIEGPLP
ncbi:MAG: hypothetical protein NC932_01875 [Candidatus Omnitrophica bacterium]|nr:hypothetical protein [Candidatus Omnitrophota bacterium]MCM8830136.1 hypothetical protein [Candidatus Omnitrophota bacterium]